MVQIFRVGGRDIKLPLHCTLHGRNQYQHCKNGHGHLYALVHLAQFITVIGISWRCTSRLEMGGSHCLSAQQCHVSTPLEKQLMCMSFPATKCWILKLLHSFSASWLCKQIRVLPNVQLFMGTEGGKISGIKLCIGYKTTNSRFQINWNDCGWLITGWTPILSQRSAHKSQRKNMRGTILQVGTSPTNQFRRRTHFHRDSIVIATRQQSVFF